jgi:hypothetical protein
LAGTQSRPSQSFGAGTLAFHRSAAFPDAGGASSPPSQRFVVEGASASQRSQVIAGFRFRTFSSEARFDVVVKESRFVPLPRLVEALFRLAPPAN